MATRLNFDRASFIGLAKDLRRVKRLTAPEMILYMGKILVRYLIAATPPFDKKQNPFGEHPWAAQKATGIASIKHDFSRAFQPFTLEAVQRYTGNINARAIIYIKRYAKAGQADKLNTILRGLKLPGHLRIIRTLTPSLARSAIDFSRRPHRIKQRYFVMDKASIKEELKNAIAHVGRAKSGWLKAAERVGFKGAPQWVKRHRGYHDGAIIDQLYDPNLPSLTMINNAKGAAAVDDDVVAAAMNELYRSGLKKQLEAIAAKRVRHFNSLR